tara:strand:- start:216 stop:389 length:174 start_codon:yes stop_codon:yes gene_type:complete
MSIVIPAVWKQRWDQGRDFYRSIGHGVNDRKIPQVSKIMRRGVLWAARGAKEKPNSP